MVFGLICFGFSDGGNLFWGKRMRALIVLPKIFPLGGVEKLTIDLIKELYEREYIIDLLFLNKHEINNRPIIKLSDILESTKETAISEEKNMMDYDEKLLREFGEGWKWSVDLTFNEYIKHFLNNRYPNKELEDLLKQREELDKRINELKSL